ncbi:MAG: CoA activase [Desulfobacterales bacterium S7086C20]|nr:MAG: CoA activase [Desulfobacterales bacterium S7086C20]
MSEITETNASTASVPKTLVHLGIDVGSISVNTVLVNDSSEIVWEDYSRTRGRPLETTASVLTRLYEKIPTETIASCSLTGTGATHLAKVLGGIFVNEIIAQTKAAEHFHQDIKTIIEMGGEDAKLILTHRDSAGNLIIEDFAMNSLCAAGTGSFLDQQAHRMGYSIEDFSKLALQSETPPRIAGRCTVFAKTDMIHLQQAATPDFEIIAGLCFALARNLKSNIGKGKNLLAPVVFQGGVAANHGVRKAFQEVLKLNDGQLIVPKHFASMGAIGAVLKTMENGTSVKRFNGLERLNEYIATHTAKAKHLPPLEYKAARRDNIHGNEQTTRPEGQKSGQPEEVYLGIDVGSISTNVVLINNNRKLVAKVYLMTAGRPLEAVKEGLRIIGEKYAGKVKVVGAATTGSGRYLTGDFVGADIIRNEITAQATAAADIDPMVDTIFEIGGQDSKYISLKNGVIVDFMMNKVCAAGTGSFLEEQAEKLGMSIKEEFGSLAISAKNPIRLGERCTVFMESDLVHYQQQGSNKDDLVAGLSYSIVENYLNRVVEQRKVGDLIFYQGATAQNAGIVAAFEKVVGKPVTVPPHCDVTGAIGAGLLAMKERNWKESRFKGFDVSKSQYTTTSFECAKCPNRCEIRKVSVESRRPLFYGGRCERYENKRQSTENRKLPDLFAQRQEWLLETPFQEMVYTAPRGRHGTIGIPRTMFFMELAPFFITFLETLGYEVIISEQTHKKLIHKGLECTVAETCFPIKVAHGHILDLFDKGVKTIFLPHVVDLKHASQSSFSYLCPYAQTLAYMIHSSIDFKKAQVRALQPVLYFGRGYSKLLRGLKSLSKSLAVNSRAINNATAAAWKAQERFYNRLRNRGDEILSGLAPDEKLMIIVSRPYNGFDPGINLNLPKKLRDLDTLAMPVDFLRLDEHSPDNSSITSQYWRFGQKIMSAAEIIRDNPQLFAIYITNFGCGPDSFISHFFHDRLQGKPYLEIEIDEHSADVGAITRLEAFLDSLNNARLKPKKTRSQVYHRHNGTYRRKVFIPPMSDQAYAVAAAFRACGVDSEVLPESDEQTLSIGHQFTSGKECYPCILTTGDMIKRVRNTGFDPDRSAFFMPSGTGPCRYGQYHRFHRLVLDRLGYGNVPIYAPNQSEVFYKELGMVNGDFPKLGWQGLVAVDLLEKLVRQVRPYEREPGASNRAYSDALEKICRTVENRGNIVRTLRETKASFETIPKNGLGTKPFVGIVGEIYTRANRFANEDAILKIEALGAEAWMSPVAEWVLYINYIAKERSLQKKQLKTWLKNVWVDYLQRRYEHRYSAVFDGMLRYLWEPSTRSILKNAMPYIHPSFRGESVLSLGKSVDYIKRQTAGLVSIMPFTCMPGTIVSALLKRFKEENNNIPYLNLSYDGQTETNTSTRLEAFMYQVHRRHELFLENEMQR